LFCNTASRAGAATAKKGKGGGGGEQLQVDPEAGPELKEALEVRSTGTTLIVFILNSPSQLNDFF